MKKISTAALAGALLLPILACLAPLPAGAAPLSVAFSGTIHSVTDPDGRLDPSIQVGSPFAGSYTIDLDDLTPLPQFDGTLYLLLGGGPVGELVATVESEGFVRSVGGVFVADDRTFSEPAFGFGDLWAPAQPFEAGTVGIAIVFFDSTGTRLAHEDLFVNQTLAGWDRAELRITYLSGTPDAPMAETLAIGSLLPPAPPENLRHGVHSNDDGLSTIDPAHAASTFIGFLDPDPTRFVAPTSLAARASDGELFGWENR